MDDARNPLITVTVTRLDGEAQEFQAAAAGTLMELLRDAGMVEAVCGGAMACATCAVELSEHWARLLPRPDADEAALLACFNADDGRFVRLSCQLPLAPALDGLKLRVVADDD